MRVHVLLDGRDVSEKSALGYVDALEELLETTRRADRDYRIASGGGRMQVSMDRYEADWRIVERGYNAHVHGDARCFRSAREAIETFYHEDGRRTDQNHRPQRSKEAAERQEPRHASAYRTPDRGHLLEASSSSVRSNRLA